MTVHRHNRLTSKLRVCLSLLLALTSLTPLHAQQPAKDPLADKTPEGMVFVPAGAFTMGTNAADAAGSNLRQNNDALPQHTVTVPPFYIDKTEVTNAQYKRYCDATGYSVPPHWKKGTYPEGEAESPVTHVNWWEASAYAAWAGKRLPTEAEWEKAARGTDGRLYPWGNTWDGTLVVIARDKPQPVGTKPGGASPYGALDMASNVLEWVQDWYGPYPGARHTYPEYGTQYKVLRGGFFWGAGIEVMSTTFYRSVNRPGTRHSAIGFRCAKGAG